MEQRRAAIRMNKGLYCVQLTPISRSSPRGSRVWQDSRFRRLSAASFVLDQDWTVDMPRKPPIPRGGGGIRGAFEGSTSRRTSGRLLNALCCQSKHHGSEIGTKILIECALLNVEVEVEIYANLILDKLLEPLSICRA